MKKVWGGARKGEDGEMGESERGSEKVAVGKGERV